MIEIASLRGVATVQDAGRPGHMHEGVPPGGALVPELLARANRAAGNDDDAAAIELFGGMTLTAHDDVLVSTDVGLAHELHAGDRLDVAPDARARVRYVAIGGGIDVPRVLGGRGTLLVAQLGGLDGRPLRRGDRLGAGASRGSTRASVPPLDLDAAVRVVLGPDQSRFPPEAVATLLSGEFRISPIGDRVGQRLVGPPIARLDADDGLSGPMLRGAIEVPASGELVVLGPDHPTTGGYPVIAVVARASLGAFAARKPGAAVRFIAS